MQYSLDRRLEIGDSSEALRPRRDARSFVGGRYATQRDNGYAKTPRGIAKGFET